tara:strand:- start:246 stop:1604 length:1359 start_codon:yes stop_codon:yes gene_type:complete
MKRLIFFLFLLLFFTSCSFDNKTGIWKNAEDIAEKKEQIKDEKLIDVFTENRVFDEEKNNEDIKINIENSLQNSNWADEFFNLNNNIPNISYKNNKILVSKILKISKLKYSKDRLIRPLIYNQKIILTNNKGVIYIFSLITQKKLFEFNFYKKKYRKYKKEIYLIIKDNTIFAADNLGYMYAINIENQKIIWAKNFGVPFRSNIKIIDNLIFLSNQENELLAVNLSNGEKMWQFQTTPQLLKSSFINNILIDQKNENVLFLNNYGELYSVNYRSREINWFKAFKTFSSTDKNDLFIGTPLSLKSKSLIISTGKIIANVNPISGIIIWTKNIPSKVKPILTEKHIFVISDNKLLICLNKASGKVLWSTNIVKRSKEKDRKSNYKNLDFIKTILIVDDKLFLFSDAGFLLTFELQNGNLISLDRILKKQLGSEPVFSEGNMYLFNKSSQLFKFE